jgi:hypothetical protein
MASKRFELQKPNGRIRHREKESTFVGSFRGKVQLLPKNVFTKDIPFFNPSDKIITHFKDGDLVNIDMYDHLPVDEFDSPVYSAWAFIAFRTSEKFAHRREQLIKEKELEVNELSAFKEREAEEQRIAHCRPKLQKMRDILKEQLVDDDTILTSMKNEWSLIEKSGALESLIPAQNEQETIKAFFTEHYAELSEMYKYYSAVNSGGGTHTLEYIEVSEHLCF